jgi:hypothetical protein
MAVRETGHRRSKRRSLSVTATRLSEASVTTALLIISSEQSPDNWGSQEVEYLDTPFLLTGKLPVNNQAACKRLIDSLITINPIKSSSPIFIF